METIENKIEYIYSAKELNQKLKQFIYDVESLIQKNNYQLNDTSISELKKYNNIDWTSYFYNMSKNMRKKTNKYLRRFQIKNNRHSANLFLHFIHTRILSERNIENYRYYSSDRYYEYFNQPNWIDKIKISASFKEKRILYKRKKWLELRDKAIIALNEYKKEKDNFYTTERKTL